MLRLTEISGYDPLAPARPWWEANRGWVALAVVLLALALIAGGWLRTRLG